MNKKMKKGLSIFLSLVMVLSLLPAQFALAVVDNSTDREKDVIPVQHGTLDALASSGFAGHVLELNKVTDNANYDYEMVVQAYNMEPVINYQLCMTYDTNDVTWVRRNGTPYASSSTATNMLRAGTVTRNMISEAAANYSEDDGDDVILGKNLNTVLFSDAWEIKVTEGIDSTTKNQIVVSTAVSYGLSEEDWTNAGTGAVSKLQDGYKVYGFPKNERNTLYTMYFKLKDSSKDITPTTFEMSYDRTNWVNGSAGTRQDEDRNHYYENENTYLVNFPEKEMAKQSVEFTKIEDSKGNPLNEADVKIYEGSSAVRAATLVTQGKTDTNGHYKSDAVLSVNKPYHYVISKTGYADQTADFTIAGEATHTIASVQMVAETEATYPVTITVKNADTNQPVEGARVIIGGNYLSGTTNSSGIVTGTSKAGTFALEAEANNFEKAVGSITVNKTGTNQASISMEPQRAEVTIPTINAEGNPDITITATQTSEGTTGWGGKGDSKNYTTSDSVKLPQGDFTIEISAPGFAPSIMYVHVDASNNVTYFSDAEHNTTVDPSTPINLEKMSDPYYNVKIVKDETNTKQYNATVTLGNINTQGATFGIKYDKDVFDLTSFDLNTDQLILFDAKTGTAAEEPLAENAAEGYHIFQWAAVGYDGGDKDNPEYKDLDARTTPQKIATYKFTLKSGKTEADITADAFTVMPYDKTKEGREYIAANADDLNEGQNFSDTWWRYTMDSTNDESAPKARRLEKSKATLNGFYQAYAAFLGDAETIPDFDPDNDSEENSLFYDVLTTFEFDHQKSALTFVVTDKETGLPLGNTSITLYDQTGTTVVDTITTNDSGMVTYPVDGDADFQYIASCQGYWDIPETAKNPVSVKNNETTIEYVEMEKKIYHTPVLEFADPTSTPNNDKVHLAGDKFAYTGRDFYFYLDADTGYKIEDGANVVVEVTYDDGTVKTVKPTIKDGVYYVEAAEIVGSPTNDTPDINGFPSYDIKIKVIEATITKTEEKFTATANVGKNGTVDYEADTGEIPKPSTVTTPVEDGSIVIEEIDPIAVPAPVLGDFKFQAKPGYKVEKVFVNGIQIHDYDDLENFDYTFTDLTMDNDITVTFYDGTPSEEGVITLVVGPKGKVDVTAPDAVTDITDTRKTYVYTKADIEGSNNTLNFTVKPDAGATVKVQSEKDGVKTDITSTGTGTDSHDYTVTVNKNENLIVYVTFDENTIFVKTYVKSGEGKIEPLGVLIKKKHDSVTVTMTAKPSNPGDEKNWSAVAVDVNGKEIKNADKAQPFVYTVESIQEDTEIGAIFEETAFTVTGYVDLSQASNITTDNANTGATVYCTRQSDGYAVAPVVTTTDRKNAAFSVELPKGVWTITVKKKGYINYTVTDFTVEGTSNVTFGLADGETDTSEAKKITPYIGNTDGSGKVISFLDANVIANGLRPHANQVIKNRSNVDDDEAITYYDLLYVKYNYGRRTVKETYDDFMANTITNPYIPDSEK